MLRRIAAKELGHDHVADNAGQPAIRVGPGLLRLHRVGHKNTQVALNGKVAPGRALGKAKGMIALLKVAVRIEWIQGLFGLLDLGDVPYRVAQRLDLSVGQLFEPLVNFHARTPLRQADRPHAARPVVLAHRAGNHHPFGQQLSLVYRAVKSVVGRPSVPVDFDKLALLVGPDLVAAEIGPRVLAFRINIGPTVGQHLTVERRIGPEDVFAPDESVVHDATDGRHHDYAHLGICNFNRVCPALVFDFLDRDLGHSGRGQCHQHTALQPFH